MPDRTMTLAEATVLALVLAACRTDARGTEARGTEARGTEARGTSAACGATTFAAGDTGTRTIPVNRGSHGMAAFTRWIVSPDGCSLLVMEDPVSVEAEPVANGALFVSEHAQLAGVVAIDSVWDVAPAADWRTIAYGKAWVLRNGEADTIPASRWRALAARLGIDAASLERESWPASGMVYARGGAVAWVHPLARDGAGTTGAARRVGQGGWRVAWRGDTAWFGSTPQRSQDADPATRWRRLLPGAAALVDAIAGAPTGGSAGAGWAQGPVIEFGQPVRAMDSLRTLPIDGGAVEGRRGTIVLRRTGVAERRVGAGVPLAATRGGRFVAALAPAPAAGEHDPKVRLVVYEVRDAAHIP